MKNRFICLFICILSMSTIMTNAQQFQKGYIITTKNDTVNGWLSLQGESENSSMCTFKKLEKGKVETFTPNKINGYRYAESGRFFISQKLVIDHKPVFVFLEYILKGKASLYYYRIEGIDIYLLKASDGTFYEMKNGDVVKESGIFVYENIKDERYKEVLNEVFKDCPELSADINAAELNRKSLIKLTTKYNNLTGNVSIKNVIYQKNKVAFKTTFMLKGGMTYLYSSLEGKDINNDSYSVNEMWSPLLGLQVDYFLAEQSPTLRLTGAVTIAKLQSENYTTKTYPTGDVYLNKVFYNAVHYNFYLGAKYIYPAKYFRPYLGLGGLCTLLSNSNIGLQKESRGISTQGTVQKPNLTFFGQLSRQFGIYGDVGFEVSVFKGLSLVYGAQAEYTKFGLGINSSLGVKF